MCKRAGMRDHVNPGGNGQAGSQPELKAVVYSSSEGKKLAMVNKSGLSLSDSTQEQCTEYGVG